MDEDKKAKIAEYFKENPTAGIREAAALFGVTYQQAYMVSRTERGPMRKKKAVKAKSKKQPKISPLRPAPTVAIEDVAVDMVNHPPHYKKGGIETIDFIEAKELNYNLGNVVKYVTRSGLKGTRIEDLKKAVWYLNREVESLGS